MTQIVTLAAEGGYQVFNLAGGEWFWLILSAATAILACALRKTSVISARRIIGIAASMWRAAGILKSCRRMTCLLASAWLAK